MDYTISNLSTGDLTGFGGFVVVFLILYLGVLFSIVAFSVLSYVLYGIGLQTIARQRGIRNGWMAWLPIVNGWILGSVSDQYQYLVKGRIKNRRKQLLFLQIGIAVLSVLYSMCATAQVVYGMPVAGYRICRYAVGVFTVILSVMEYMAYYDLYRSCKPNRKVVFLVLSIVLPVTLPFFVFSCREHDGGMPPRKQPQISREPEPVNAYPTEPVNAYPTEPVNAYPTEPENAYPTEPVNVYPTEPVEEGFAQPEDFEEE